MCLMVAVLAVVLSGWIIWENKKAEREGMLVDGEYETDAAEYEGRRVKHRMVW